MIFFQQSFVLLAVFLGISKAFFIKYPVVSKSVLPSSSSATSKLSSALFDIDGQKSPYFGYKLIDPRKPTYAVAVVDTVKGFPRDVFNLARDWTKDSPYWDKQISKFNKHNSSGNPDGVGDYRKYIMNGRTYSDELLHVDRDNLKFAYGVLSADPPVLKGAVTLAEFEMVEGNEQLTKVTWSVIFQPEYDIPSMVALIKQVQCAGFQEHIATLKTFFTDEDSSRSPFQIGTAALMIADDLGSKVKEITTEMVKRAPTDKWGYDHYDKTLGPLPTYTKILPATAAINPARLGQIFQRNMEYVYSQTPLIGYFGVLEKILGLNKFDETIFKLTGTWEEFKTKFLHLLEDPFMAPFTEMWFPEPTTIIANLKDPIKSDLEIAAQLIRGTNPMKITVAKSSNDLPIELRSLKDDNGRSVDDLIKTKSLFYCDYWEVAVGDYDEEKGVYCNQANGIGSVGKLGSMKYWYAPRLAVYKKDDGKLDILGFVLTRFNDKPNEVYAKASTPPNLYQLAKLHLTCADNQHHQFVSHLGMAHLNMEPFAIATHNAFPPVPKRHPIGRLLHPHFQDTIGINWLARQTLVSTVAPFTDATFSPGTTNAMRIFSRAFQKWDFLEDNFVNHLKHRGFDENKSDDLDNYYYRDDGFLIWNAIKNHVCRVVNKIYCSDKEVKSDDDIKSWIFEIRDYSKGNIQSFPKHISTCEDLIEILTSIIFYCSAQHAAVNFSQLRYVAYCPNRPDNMRLPMVSPAEGEKDIALNVLFEALPSLSVVEFQSLFSYLLSCPPDNPFDPVHYHSAGDEFHESTELFLKELGEIHKSISERNVELEKAGEVPYEYLDPYQIPQSINI